VLRRPYDGAANSRRPKHWAGKRNVSVQCSLGCGSLLADVWNWRRIVYSVRLVSIRAAIANYFAQSAHSALRLRQIVRQQSWRQSIVAPPVAPCFVSSVRVILHDTRCFAVLASIVKRFHAIQDHRGCSMRKIFASLEGNCCCFSSRIGGHRLGVARCWESVYRQSRFPACSSMPICFVVEKPADRASACIGEASAAADLEPHSVLSVVRFKASSASASRDSFARFAALGASVLTTGAVDFWPVSLPACRADGGVPCRKIA